MTADRINDLLAKSLAGNYDDEAPWAAIRELRLMGSRDVFEHAVIWCKSNDPLVRARGLDVLAQIGKTADHPEHLFPGESYTIVVGVLEEEQEIRPLASAIYALGHIENPHAVSLVAPYESHPDPDIWYAVACALGSFPNDSQSIRSLIGLMGDVDDDVRDWATFALGVLGDADSKEIRDALVQRLTDPCQDVRDEAIDGLAKRRDHRFCCHCLRSYAKLTFRVRCLMLLAPCLK
ncbi:MAG: HEAT repeat domain-containing protein [Candidatus Sulfotelmatobacter sp.]